jgi:DNA polymerase II small subunit/DNA polymerase delta subunit B
MTGGEKPSILINGHHHKAMYLFYRNVHAIECGTLEAQSGWMKGKRIAAHVGGWIIEIHVDEEGTINRFKSEFIPFYKMIKDDY